MSNTLERKYSKLKEWQYNPAIHYGVWASVGSEKMEQIKSKLESDGFHLVDNALVLDVDSGLLAGGKEGWDMRLVSHLDFLRMVAEKQNVVGQVRCHPHILGSGETAQVVVFFSIKPKSNESDFTVMTLFTGGCNSNEHPREWKAKTKLRDYKGGDWGVPGLDDLLK